MRLKIVQVGEAVLRQEARKLSPEEIVSPKIQQLIELMRDTMRDAPGVGLAAPQIGESVRIAVVEDRPEYLTGIPEDKLAERERQPVPLLTLINPRITVYSNDQVEFFEGCLSLTGYSALVKRARSVTVEYLDETATRRTIEASGWFARILQHEIDHLNGFLYIDHMEPRSFSSLDNINRYWKDLPVSAVRKALDGEI